MSLKLPHYLSLPGDKDCTLLKREFKNPLVQDYITKHIKKLINQDLVKVKVNGLANPTILDNGRIRFTGIVPYTVSELHAMGGCVCSNNMQTVGDPATLEFPQLPCALIEVQNFKNTEMVLVPLEKMIVEQHPLDQFAHEFISHAYKALRV